jgi:drug/metabolite transporter (DMT)-like permease
MRTTDWLLLFALSVLWGGTYFFAVIATHSVPPLTLVLLRVALAAMVLVPIVLLMGFRLPRDIGTWRSLAILATLNNIIPFTLSFYGQPHVTGGLASVINATTPLFTIIIAPKTAPAPLPFLFLRTPYSATADVVSMSAVLTVSRVIAVCVPSHRTTAR